MVFRHAPIPRKGSGNQSTTAQNKRRVLKAARLPCRFQVWNHVLCHVGVDTNRSLNLKLELESKRLFFSVMVSSRRMHCVALKAELADFRPQVGLYVDRTAENGTAAQENVFYFVVYHKGEERLAQTTTDY